MNKDSLPLVVRNQLFLRFLTCQTISQLGTTIFDFAVPLFVYQQTRSASALAMVVFCQNLPFFLMAPVTAYFADHVNKRFVFFLTDFGQILCQLGLLFIVTKLGSGMSSDIWPVLAMVFLTKFLTTLYETMATFQLLPALVGPNDLARGNGWFLSGQRFIQILGPLSGGLLLGAYGFEACIIANLLSFAASLHFTFKLRHMNQLFLADCPELAEKRDFWETFMESLRFCVQSPVFRPFIYLMFFWNLSSFLPSTPTVTYYFTEIHGFSAAQYGLITALFGLVGLLGYVKTSFSPAMNLEAELVRSSVVQAILGTVALIVFKFPIALAVCLGLTRGNSASLTLATFVLRQTLIPKKYSGAVNATVRMFFMSAAPLAALLQGMILPRFGAFASLAFGIACLWGTAWQAKAVASAYSREISVGKREKAIA